MWLSVLWISVLVSLVSSKSLPQGGSSLKYLQVLFRHGDRTPSHVYPNDPHRPDTWPEGWKKLTPQGCRDSFALGKFMRARYIDTGYMPGNYTEGDMYMLSSQEDRCTMSAYCMLAGFYPPSGHQLWNPDLLWQPIPVHTIPKGEDFLLRVPCPTYEVLYDEMMKSELVQNLTEEYQDLINITGVYSGYEPTFRNLMNMVDPINVEILHNLTLPEWLMKDDLYKRYLGLKDALESLKFPTIEMTKIRGGPILKKIIKNMEDKINTNNITVKTNFFSGHSTTVTGLLSALKIYNKKHFMYSASILFELHHTEAEGWRVKIYYYNDTSVEPYLMTVPGCDSACPVADLKRLTHDTVPDDVVETCLGPEPTSPPVQQPVCASAAHAPTGSKFTSLVLTAIFLLTSISPNFLQSNRFP